MLKCENKIRFLWYPLKASLFRLSEATAGLSAVLAFESVLLFSKRVKLGQVIQKCANRKAFTLDEWSLRWRSNAKFQKWLRLG